MIPDQAFKDLLHAIINSTNTISGEDRGALCDYVERIFGDAPPSPDVITSFYGTLKDLALKATGHAEHKEHTCAGNCRCKAEQPASTPTTTDVLEEAHRIIHGERKDAYGKAEDSFDLIARFWNNYLCVAGKRPDCMNTRDVAMMMILLKVARDAHSPKRDDLVDIAGYAALAENM